MLPSDSLVLKETERPMRSLSFWERKLQVSLTEEPPVVSQSHLTVSEENWIRRLGKLDVKSRSCQAAISSRWGGHIMIRHSSSAEVVTGRAFRIPKLIWQVSARSFVTPRATCKRFKRSQSDLQAPPASRWSRGRVERTRSHHHPPDNRRGLSPSSAVAVCDPDLLSSPRSFHRATLSSALSLTVRRDLGQQERARWRRDLMFVPP